MLVWCVLIAALIGQASASASAPSEPPPGGAETPAAGIPSEERRPEETRPEEPAPEEAPPPEPTTMARRRLGFGLAFGINRDAHLEFPGLTLALPGIALGGGGAYGITPRLQWIAPLPLFAYRFGDAPGIELVPWGGVTRVVLGSSEGDGFLFEYALGLGLDGRVWLGQRQSFNFGARWATAGFVTALKRVPDQPPDTFRITLTAGYSLHLGDWLSLNLSLGLGQNVLVNGRPSRFAAGDRGYDLRLGFGAMQTMGARPLPLLQFHVSPRLSVDGYVVLEWRVRDNQFLDAYLLGATLRF